MEDLTVHALSTYPLKPKETPLADGVHAGGVDEKRTELRALKRACRDFESILVYTLLKAMRSTLPKSERENAPNKLYTSMGDLELSRSISHGRGLGLGELLYQELKSRVE